MATKRAVIIGAGPAGLTAAYELQERSDIQPLVLEKGDYTGGLSRTTNYKGNRMDIGGHRFFSKSDRVMQWWLNILPLEEKARAAAAFLSRFQTAPDRPAGEPADPNSIMLVRKRKSRIYFLRQLFDYPIRLTLETLRKLGLWKSMRIGFSYLRVSLFPLKDESTLESFFINRFGRELYRTFFKSYTEKVWGVPCNQISSEWGAQRIKGLSIWKALAHFAKQLAGRSGGDIRQKGTETSLIEQFLYPKYGPGQMWEEVARRVKNRGGVIHYSSDVRRIHYEGTRITAVEVVDSKTGESRAIEGDYFFSTMPIKELVEAMGSEVPEDIRRIAGGLLYRDFITVGLLVNRLRIHDETDEGRKLIEDNWIYIQEADVEVGRLQVFNNWSPYMVADPDKVWLGLEYFCNDTDDLWRKSDTDMVALAREELARLRIIAADDVLDGCVLRVPKAYPAYFGTYSEFAKLREFLDGFENLYLVGRNGMHKYNNQDHSMLTAMAAVENLLAMRKDKSNIWAVNTEQDYHEERKEPAGDKAAAT